MRRAISVSIGIPAYNEEDNIQILLRTLIRQKQKNIKILEVIVVSDGSTDNTVREVRKVENNKIKLLINHKRIGQALSQNLIVKKMKGDILVILNADIRIKNNFFIEKLVHPMCNNSNIGIVSPKIVPLPAQGLFESIINYSVEFKNEIYSSWRKSNNIYICHGRARAISRKLLKKIRWKRVYSEDAYSYLYCIREGYQFAYQPNTRIFYRSPKNFEDHRKQSVRFFRSINELSKYFDRSFIAKEYDIPKSIILKKVTTYFFKNIFFSSAYIIILCLNIILPYKNINYIFSTSKSSKILSKT